LRVESAGHTKASAAKAAGEAATAEGGPLEFRADADAELEKVVARVLRAQCPSLQFEEDPMAGAAGLAGSFVAYAAEKIPFDREIRQFQAMDSVGMAAGAG